MEGSGVRGLAARDPGIREEYRLGPLGGTDVAAPCLQPTCGSDSLRPTLFPERERTTWEAGVEGWVWLHGKSCSSLAERGVGLRGMDCCSSQCAFVWRGEPGPGGLSLCQFLLPGFEGFCEGLK